MQVYKWLLAPVLLMLASNVAAIDVQILTPDNVNDLVNPEFSLVAEVGLDADQVDFEGTITVAIDDGFLSSSIVITCGNIETSPEIMLHNNRRVEGWVCSSDLCKLVVSAEVDLSEWELQSDDELTATVTVDLGDGIFDSDTKKFTVR